MGIEIERKFTVKKLPEDLNQYPFHVIEQGYLNVHPAIRVRREDDIYYMTYKGSSDLNQAVHCIANDHSEQSDAISNKSENIGKVEYNMPLDEVSYNHIVSKADGNIIRKKRYLIPLNKNAFDDVFLSENPSIKDAVNAGNIKIELDIFDAPFEGTIIAEVEFPTEESAKAYIPADWFDKDVTGNIEYSNSHMSSLKFNWNHLIVYINKLSILRKP